MSAFVPDLPAGVAVRRQTTDDRLSRTHAQDLLSLVNFMLLTPDAMLLADGMMHMVTNHCQKAHCMTSKPQSILPKS